MNVTTLDAVTYGVDDLGVAKSFWTDFGLTLLEEDDQRLLFCSQDQSTVEIRPSEDPALPPAIADETWMARGPMTFWCVISTRSSPSTALAGCISCSTQEGHLTSRMAIRSHNPGPLPGLRM